MNPRARSSCLLGFTLIALGLNAQEQKAVSTEPKAQTGTIEGHVICGDTRSPARLATVFIIPIPVFDDSGKPILPKVNGGDIAMTNLDGNYTLSKVAPGDYFLLAELRGYSSPITGSYWSKLREPTPDSTRRLAKLLLSVHVESGKTAHVDAVLERGASISGKVLYDDGTPAIGVHVHVDRAQEGHEKDWHIIRGLTPNWELSTTDDRGRYRINGLPDGEYVIKVSMDGVATGNNPLANGDTNTSPDKVYGEDWNTTYAEKTLYRKNAKVFKLAPGEDLTGADIEIPLNGLYSISGTVTVQPDQPPVFFGFVSLVDLDDKTFIRRALIHADGSFLFPYLPPAKYQLKTAWLSDQSPIHKMGEEQKLSYQYPEIGTTAEIIDQDLKDITLTIPKTAPKPTDTDSPKQ